MEKIFNLNESNWVQFCTILYFHWDENENLKRNENQPMCNNAIIVGLELVEKKRDRNSHWNNWMKKNGDFL